MSQRTVLGIHKDSAELWSMTPRPTDSEVDSVVVAATSDGYVDAGEAEAIKAYRRTTQLSSEQMQKLIHAEKAGLVGVSQVWLTQEDRLDVENAPLPRHSDAAIDSVYRDPAAFDSLTRRQKRNLDIQTVAALRGNLNAAKQRNSTPVVELAGQAKIFSSRDANRTLEQQRADQRARVVAWVLRLPAEYSRLDAQWRHDPEVIAAVRKVRPSLVDGAKDVPVEEIQGLSEADRLRLVSRLSGEQLRAGWGETLFGGIYSELSVVKRVDPQRYDTIVTRANAAGIEQFQRFGKLHHLERVLKDHANAAEDHRPVALFIVTTTDHNGAFASIERMIRDVPSGYRVRYVEANDKIGLERAYAEQQASGQPAEVVVRAGHGSQHGFEMGKDVVSESDIVSLGQKYPNAVAAGAVLINVSCSTGKGRAQEKNIVNADEAAWPHASSQGPVKPTNARGLAVKDGKIVGADFFKSHQSEDVVYQTP